MIVAKIMEILFRSILANFLISLASLAGILTLSIKSQLLERWLLNLVALSAGAMIGSSFFHLLPEAAENLASDQLYLIVFLAFSVFFLIEKILLWHHCHKGREQAHVFGYMNLIGDGIHNFLDGLIITAALLADTRLGLVSIIAIALHEIPQEISDYGVLLYSGFSRFRALIYNLLVGFTAIAGGIIGYYLSIVINDLVSYILPFAAGGFIYIAGSDLMPEIRRENDLKKSLTSFGVFLLGVGLMYLLK